MADAPLPSEAEVKGMKVAELKDALEKLGLPKTGLKAELMERLLGHIQQAAAAGGGGGGGQEEEGTAEPAVPPPQQQPSPPQEQQAAPAPAPAPAPALASPPKPKPQAKAQAPPQEEEQAPAPTPSPAPVPAPAPAPPKVDLVALEARLKQEKEAAAAAVAAAAATAAAAAGAAAKAKAAATAAAPAPSAAAAAAGAGTGPSPSTASVPLGVRAEGFVVPPAQEPVSHTIHVEGFVRPFMLPKAEALMSLKGGGPLVPEHGFWMDGFKKHCYATFESEECAARAREGLYGLKWPDERGGSLTAEFAPAGMTAQQVAEAEAAERTARALARANNVPYVPPPARINQQQQAQAQKPPQGQQQQQNGSGGGGGGGGNSLLARALSDVSQDASGAGIGRRKRELGPSPDRGVSGVSGDATAAAAAGGKKQRVSGEGGGGGERPPPLPGLDELFRVTKAAKPKLYWLPVDEGTVEAKRARRAELRKEAKARAGAGAGAGGGGRGGAGGKRGRSYSRSRSRSRSPPYRGGGRR